MKINKILVGIMMIFCTVMNAQQEPQYSQYMYNMSTVNPGYVTNQSGLISTGALYRKQWTNINGAPTTANVFANIPLSEKMELSINYVNDRIGEGIKVNNNFANIDYAYIARVSDQLKLSFGLKAGINSFNLNASGSDVSSDPVFMNNPSQTSLTLGAGIFAFTHNFYAGISVPNLLPNELVNQDFEVTESSSHLYFISGYVFDLASEIKLKPSVVVKQPINAPFSFDVSLNALFYDKLELGASYRYTDALVALAGFNITQNLKIGYSYDFGMGELGNFNTGSHEIILLFNFDLLNLSNTYTSPRFY